MKHLISILILCFVTVLITAQDCSDVAFTPIEWRNPDHAQNWLNSYDRVHSALVDYYDEDQTDARRIQRLCNFESNYPYAKEYLDNYKEDDDYEKSDSGIFVKKVDPIKVARRKARLDESMTRRKKKPNNNIVVKRPVREAETASPSNGRNFSVFNSIEDPVLRDRARDSFLAGDGERKFINKFKRKEINKIGEDIGVRLKSIRLKKDAGSRLYKVISNSINN